MLRSLLTFILIYLFVSPLLFGQELLFRELEEVTLPSSECYSIIQDKKGYLWIATEEGFCRYSKNNLFVFDKKNGLPERAVYASLADKDGKVWIATSKRRILYHKDGKLTEVKPLKPRPEHLQPYHKFSFPYALNTDGKGNLYVSEYNYSRIVNIVTGRTTEIPQPEEGEMLFHRSENSVLIPTRIGNGIGVKLMSYTVSIRSDKRTIRIPIPRAYLPPPFNALVSTCRSGQYDFIGVDECLIRLGKDGSYTPYYFPSRIISTKTDKAGGIWVGLYKGGVYYFPDVRNMSYRIHSLKTLSVSGFCEDNENVVWCTTLEKGVFYCVNKNIIGFPGNPGLNSKATLLKYAAGKVFFSSEGNRLFTLNGAGFRQYTLPNSKYDEFIEIAPYGRRMVISSKVQCDMLDSKFRPTGEHIYLTHDNYIKRKDPIQFWGYENVDVKGIIYSVSYGYIAKCTGLSANSIFVTRGPGRCLVKRNDHELVIGGIQYLQILNLVTEKVTDITPGIGEATKVVSNGNGDVYVTTRDQGLFILKKGSFTVEKVPVKLPTDVLYDMNLDKNGILWIGSNAGLIRLEKTGGTYKAITYTTIHGLSSNGVNKVTSDRKHVYYSTFEGVFCFPLAVDFTRQHSPRPILLKIDVNGKTIKSFRGILNLSYDQNNLKLSFDFTIFREQSMMVYDLKSEAGNSQQLVDGREFLLSNLSPGDYTLSVRVKNSDGYLTPKPWKLKISISPPFWATGWFILICAVFIILLTVFIAREVIKRIRRKEKFQTETNRLLAEHQMSALQAQMNPHFIFNAINTIQGYIIAQNKDEAYNYLTRFSKLIRMVLHHSEERNVPLENELEMLNIYIELEQLRFDHCFDYVLEIDPGVELHEVIIPSMVIQPFVENAIWHGIINLKKSKQGILTLRIRQEGDLLFITIEDNGVGRSTAGSYSKPGHKSIGLSVTRQRVEMLNMIFGNDSANLTITDLYTESGKASGTRIEIKLPAL